MNMEELDQLTDDAISYIQHVCDTFGPRISGSKQERNAFEELETKLRKFADFTYVDTYKVYPTFYPGDFVRIFGVCVIIGWILFFFSNVWGIFSIILPLFGLFVVFISLVKLKYWFAFFSKKGISHNVTARILPKDDKNGIQPSKKRIIIAGHMDSAFQMKITRFGDKSMLFLVFSILYTILIALFSLARILLLQGGGMKLILSLGPLGLGWLDIAFLGISIIGLPTLIITLRGFSGGIPVLGANDNLSGVALALEIGDYFAKDEHRLNNVELWVGGFGSEECGERGAENFVKKYSKLGLLKDSIAIIPESLGAGTDLAILTKELMHLVTHDKDVCSTIERAYNSLKEQGENDEFVSCRIAPDLKMGSSDGGRFALAGFPSSTVLGYEGRIMKPANWHEVTDDPKHLTRKTLRTAIGIYVHFINNLDHSMG